MWPRKKWTAKQKPFITYTFNRVGGSIGGVTLHNDIVDTQKVTDHNITINEAQNRGIGELVFNMDATQDPSYDNTVYKEVKRTADSVTLEGYDAARQLFISKTYTLHPVTDSSGKVLPGSKYIIRLTVSLLNKAPNVQDLRYLGIFAGSAYPIAKSEPKDTYTHLFYHADGSLEQEAPSHFTGGFFSTAKPRVLEGPLKDLTYAGVMSQYYATILIPQEQSAGSTVYATRQEFPLAHENNTLVPGVTLAMGIPNLAMAPNEIKTLTYDIYTGPKFNAYLRDLNLTYPAISDIMAYGWLVFLSVPMNWLLNLFHGWFGNWGVAIICMTIVVRALIWPLHKKSYLAMKRMSLVQPEMAKLKEKYPDDPQKVNMEMMKLYQKYGINPASGCVPMLIQIPIFFAFYRVLQYSAELRGQPFCLWMTDLSLPDTVGHLFGIPINILPLIMAVTMIVQMRMTPQAGERSQRIIMNLMPLMFFLVLLQLRFRPGPVLDHAEPHFHRPDGADSPPAHARAGSVPEEEKARLLPADDGTAARGPGRAAAQSQGTQHAQCDAEEINRRFYSSFPFTVRPIMRAHFFCVHGGTYPHGKTRSGTRRKERYKYRNATL